MYVNIHKYINIIYVNMYLLFYNYINYLMNILYHVQAIKLYNI